MCLRKTTLPHKSIPGSIPVVVKRSAAGNGTTYWSNVADRDPKHQHLFELNVEDSFPKLGFPYSDMVVEVDGHIIDNSQMMKYLEQIPLSILEKKWHLIKKVRERFLYDFDGTVPDAFSALMKLLESLVIEH